jgi:hypothetical protein
MVLLVDTEEAIYREMRIKAGSRLNKVELNYKFYMDWLDLANRLSQIASDLLNAKSSQ